MEFRRITNSESSNWDEMVLRSPQGTVFHTHAWLNGSDLPPIVYGIFDKKTLIGGFAFCSSRERIIGPIAQLPSFTSYLGIVAPIVEGEKVVSRLSREKEFASLVAEYMKREYAIVNINFSPGFVDMQSFLWAGYRVSVRYTYIVDVSDLNITWGRMDPTRRTNIRKAEREGYFLKRGIGVDELIPLMKDNFQRQGIWSPEYPSLVRAYYNALSLQGKGDIFGVYNRHSELMAGIFLAWDHNCCHYLMGGARESFDQGNKCKGGPSLALWEAMKFTRNELGLNGFDLGGSMIPGIEKFFRKFGGKLVPYYTVSWTRRGVTPYLAIKSQVGKLMNFWKN